MSAGRPYLPDSVHRPGLRCYRVLMEVARTRVLVWSLSGGDQTYLEGDVRRIWPIIAAESEEGAIERAMVLGPGIAGGRTPVILSVTLEHEEGSRHG